MCKLIAAEELWLLLDALQEPVPEEVHQHLENINTSTTPLLVSLTRLSLSPSRGRGEGGSYSSAYLLGR